MTASSQSSLSCTYSSRNPLGATVLTRDSTPKMHTVWVRLNAVVFFSFTVLLVLALLTAASTYGAYDPKGSGVPINHELKFNTITSIRSNGGVDKAHLTFDFKADLTPAFHWNAKQIFCMVVAEYEGNPRSNLKEGAVKVKGKYPVNQVVLWDRIVEARVSVCRFLNSLSFCLGLFVSFRFISYLCPSF